MTTYFITICAHMQQNLFQRDEVAELMVATFLKYRDAGEFELHEYVVMPNHIHLLLSLNDQQQLGRVIQLIKGGFSHSLRENEIVFRAVWEHRYHDRRVRDANEFAEFSQYVRQNPVRKGLVQQAEDYPYSSAGKRNNLSGLKPLINKRSDVDANLKVRSTDPSGKQQAALKSGSRTSCEVDAGLKARSTGVGCVDADLKVRSTRLRAK
jgi:putative transposase